MERKTNKTIEYIPIDTSNIVDGIVVYPRLSKIHPAEIPQIDYRVVAEIMKTKYLAMQGLIPVNQNKDYCSHCRYREICNKISIDRIKDINSVKPPIPPPITIALELSEKYSIDLDLVFLGKYLERLYHKLRIELRKKHGIRIPYSHDLNVFAKILENATNIPYLNIIEAFKEYQNYTNTVYMIRNKDEIPSTILDDLFKDI